MEENALRTPDFIGRLNELDNLRKAMENAAAGAGSTHIVSGEAGIGKTRLVNELILIAEEAGALVVKGWCLPDCLEPLMPVKEAFRSAGMHELVAGTPPPRLLSAYLLNDTGMLFARVERNKSEMDPDIFAAMLKAVSSFVADSLGMMGKSGIKNELSSISHSGYRILVKSKGLLSLAVVLEGMEDEFLIEDMNRILAEAEQRVKPDTIDFSGHGWLDIRLSKLITSAKYDGEFVVDDPRLRQENFYDNILMGLQRASQSKLVVLFLDDLQWADPTTLGLVHYLARNTRENSIFILGTYRPEDVMPQKDGTPHILETSLQNMSRESLFTDTRLSRLGPHDTRRIVHAALDSNAALPPEMYVRIHCETEGNPFFILEVLRLLVDEGFVRMDGGTWALVRPLDELNLPTKILDVVKRRLNRLLKAQYEILECASVVGERFGSDVVELSLEMNRISLLKNLNEIEKVHRLIHSGNSKYRFDHCKIRDVLYGNISGDLRDEYHRMVAMSYEQLFKGREAEISGELAHHYLECRDPRAEKYLIIAGDNARESYANEEAIKFYEDALGLVKDNGARCGIMEHLGSLYGIIGDCERSIQRFNEAMVLTDEPLTKANIQKNISRTLERHSEYERGIAAARTGLEMLGDAEAPVRNELYGAISWCHIRLGEYAEALELQERSILAARKLGYEKEMADGYHLTGIIWWFKGNYDKALENYEKALAIQRKIGDDRRKENTLNNIGVIYMETGRLDEALEYFKEGLEYEEMVGDKNGIASTLDNIGNLLHSKGDLDNAMEHQLRGLELYKMIGDKNGIAWSLSSLGYLYPDLGQPEKGIESFLQSAEICKEIGDQHILTYDYYGLADKYAEMGELEKAMRYVDMAMELAKELGAMREQGAATYVRGIIERNSGRFDDAMQTFDTARGMLIEVGDTYLEAAIDYDAGICLGKMGEKERANEMLRSSRVHFEKTGMKRWLAKVDRALAEIANQR